MEGATLRFGGEDYKLISYGYRGQRWVQLYQYYYNMYDGFKLSNITDIRTIWRNPVYSEGLEGYTIYTANGNFEPYEGDIMKTSNPALYSLVDKLMDIAEDLEIPFSLPDDDEEDHRGLLVNNTDSIMELAAKVSTTVKDNQRLLKILNKGAILTLAKSIDVQQQSIETITKKLANTQDMEAKINTSLKMKTEEAEDYKKRIKELEAQNAMLKLERTTFKKDVIEKLQEAIIHI